MHLYYFTNRRRAKDTIMLILSRYGTENITVFVHDGNVYVNFDGTMPDNDVAILMHYAEQCPKKIEEVLKLDEITELYRGSGISKFRV